MILDYNEFDGTEELTIIIIQIKLSLKHSV